MFKNLEKKHLLIGTSIAALLFIFIVFGPPGLFKKTSSPDYCGSCHVMYDMHDHWFLSGLHRSIKCVDCHLPNNNLVNHVIWKGIDGMKDLLYFHFMLFSDPIEITSHGKTTLQANCVRCHGDMVSRINIDAKNCWECHRRVNHRVTPLAIIE